MPNVAVRAAEADTYWSTQLETFETGKTSFRGLYPALYRNFSLNTHPSLAGLGRFVTGPPGQLRVGVPMPSGDHGVTLAPLLFAMGLLVCSESFGWPPPGEVFAAFENDDTDLG